MKGMRGLTLLPSSLGTISMHALPMRTEVFSEGNHEDNQSPQKNARVFNFGAIHTAIHGWGWTLVQRGSLSKER
eukprot:238460-Pelagomonas_calceolata.AAC.1